MLRPSRLLQHLHCQLLALPWPFSDPEPLSRSLWMRMFLSLSSGQIGAVSTSRWATWSRGASRFCSRSRYSRVSFPNLAFALAQTGNDQDLRRSLIGWGWPILAVTHELGLPRRRFGGLKCPTDGRVRRGLQASHRHAPLPRGAGLEMRCLGLQLLGGYLVSASLRTR